MRSFLGALLVLVLAGLPGGTLPAAERAPASASGREPAPTASARPDSDASHDGDASAPRPDELRVDERSPPGTCPVTEEIVDSYCAEHPDDAACRARRGE